MQEAAYKSAELLDTDRGYAGEEAAEAAEACGIRLEVVSTRKRRKALCSIAPLGGGRSFAWATRFCRLAEDFERLPATSRAALGRRRLLFFHRAFRRTRVESTTHFSDLGRSTNKLRGTDSRKVTVED
jgi:hypothetical protein